MNALQSRDRLQIVEVGMCDDGCPFRSQARCRHPSAPEHAPMKVGRPPEWCPPGSGTVTLVVRRGVAPAAAFATAFGARDGKIAAPPPKPPQLPSRPLFDRVPQIVLVALEIAARLTGLETTDLLGRKRTRTIKRARHALWYEARQLGYSLPELGRFFDRDHTTIMAGVRAVERDLSLGDQQMRALVRELHEWIVLNQGGGAR